MGQLNQKIEAWRNERSTNNTTDPYDVIDALTPNGIFPPEVVDLILQYFGPDPKSLFNSAISCKLWLQTGSLLLKGFRRYKLDPNAPKFQLRREILVQETIEKNIKNGEYWVNVLAKTYLVVNRSSTMFNFEWSISKNLIAISCDKTIRMSMGPENLFSRGKVIDLSNSRDLEDSGWGTHLVGGVQVVPSRSNWGWDWSEFSCYVDGKRTAKITCKNKVVEESSDPYRYLRVPKRVIAALNNLDESPTVLLYQRHYAQSKNVNGLSHDYTVESYDLLTGQMLHETKIDGLGPVIGFFKNYAICSSETTTVFVDLNNGVVVKKFPIGSITQNSFCICDRKIGFAVDTLVLIFDWTTGRQIKKFSINGLFDQSLYQKQNRQMQIQGMAFDRWKLVLGIGAEKEGAEDYSEKLKEGDTVPTFIAIFDMHEGFKLLQSIHLPNTFKGNRPFKIALPPKGSIIVENWSLIEIDFNHPYLGKQLPVAFFECAKEELALQVSKVPPMQFSEFVQKKLKCEISEVRSITFFERDPHIERKIRNHRKYMLDQSKGPSNWKSVRITFFFKYSATGYNDAKNFTELGEFKNYYEKLPDVVSVFDLTLKNFTPNSQSRVSHRPTSVPGNCVLIYERFNEETGQWEIIEPFAPKGIDFGWARFEDQLRYYQRQKKHKVVSIKNQGVVQFQFAKHQAKIYVKTELAKLFRWHLNEYDGRREEWTYARRCLHARADFIYHPKLTFQITHFYCKNCTMKITLNKSWGIEPFRDKLMTLSSTSPNSYQFRDDHLTFIRRYTEGVHVEEPYNREEDEKSCSIGHGHFM